MKNQYFDPKTKNSADTETSVEQDDIAGEETLNEGDYIEYVNPEDLDAVDPEDIGIGEEYL